MLKIVLPTEAGNLAHQNGTLGPTLGQLEAKIQPEASYFLTDAGRRCALYFFDLKDSSEIPAIAEIAYQGVNAGVELCPVMNQAELFKGLAAYAEGKASK